MEYFTTSKCGHSDDKAYVCSDCLTISLTSKRQGEKEEAKKYLGTHLSESSRRRAQGTHAEKSCNC